MRYEVEGPPTTGVLFDLDDDGELPNEAQFPERPGTDTRYFKGFAFKPTREGEFTLVVTAVLNGQPVAEARCPNVTVLP